MRPGTVVKVAGKDKVVGDEPKKAKRKNVPLDFQMANEKEIKQMAKKYGLEVDSIEGNPNAGLQANLIGDKEALRKFMTSDDYGMDDEDVDSHIGEFGSDAEDKKSPSAKDVFEKGTIADIEKFGKETLKLKGQEAKDFKEMTDFLKDNPDKDWVRRSLARDYADQDTKSEPDIDPETDKQMQGAADAANKKMAKAELDDAINNGDGDGAMELFQSEIGFKKMGKEGKEAKKLLDRMADYEYALIDLSKKEQDEIQDRLKELSNKYLGESVKYSGKYNIQSLSKITTRYNK
tara:strand:- start:23 stop:895 length:873 start_codon:yes stop_codon:yes gene_type:complete